MLNPAGQVPSGFTGTSTCFGGLAANSHVLDPVPVCKIFIDPAGQVPSGFTGTSTCFGGNTGSEHMLFPKHELLKGAFGGGSGGGGGGNPNPPPRISTPGQLPLASIGNGGHVC
jgi:hypothetical protein